MVDPELECTSLAPGAGARTNALATAPSAPPGRPKRGHGRPPCPFPATWRTRESLHVAAKSGRACQRVTQHSPRTVIGRLVVLRKLFLEHDAFRRHLTRLLTPALYGSLLVGAQAVGRVRSWPPMRIEGT